MEPRFKMAQEASGRIAISVVLALVVVSVLVYQCYQFDWAPPCLEASGAAARLRSALGRTLAAATLGDATSGNASSGNELLRNYTTSFEEVRDYFKEKRRAADADAMSETTPAVEKRLEGSPEEEVSGLGARREAHFWETIDMRVLKTRSKHNNMGQFPFSDCAMVGSSSSLVGRSLGREIDNHELVIRVNRMPTRTYVSDFGNRTDILFGNIFEATKGIITLMGEGSKKKCSKKAFDKGNPKCYASVTCSRSEPLCSDMVFVFKVDRHASHRPNADIWSKTTSQVGVQHKNISNAAHHLIKLETKKWTLPSTGFLAFLTFVPLCKKLKLYGYSGGVTTGDGHQMNKMHDFEAEHRLYDRFKAGDLSPSDLPEPQSWWARHLKNGLEVVRL